MNNNRVLRWLGFLCIACFTYIILRHPRRTAKTQRGISNIYIYHQPLQGADTYKINRIVSPEEQTVSEPSISCTTEADSTSLSYFDSSPYNERTSRYLPGFSPHTEWDAVYSLYLQITGSQRGLLGAPTLKLAAWRDALSECFDFHEPSYSEKFKRLVFELTPFTILIQANDDHPNLNIFVIDTLVYSNEAQSHQYNFKQHIPFNDYRDLSVMSFDKSRPTFDESSEKLTQQHIRLLADKLAEYIIEQSQKGKLLDSFNIFSIGPKAMASSRLLNIYLNGGIQAYIKNKLSPNAKRPYSSTSKTILMSRESSVSHELCKRKVFEVTEEHLEGVARPELQNTENMALAVTAYRFVIWLIPEDDIPISERSLLQRTKFGLHSCFRNLFKSIGF